MLDCVRGRDREQNGIFIIPRVQDGWLACVKNERQGGGRLKAEGERWR